MHVQTDREERDKARYREREGVREKETEHGESDNELRSHRRPDRCLSHP